MKALLIGVYEDTQNKCNQLTEFGKNLDQKIIDEFNNVNKT